MLARESTCPHCDASLRTSSALGRTAGAVLMGLTLAGCPASDDTSETMAGDGSSSSSSTTTNNPSGTTMDPGSTTIDSDPTTPGVTAAAYGNPETSDSFGTTDATDSDSTSSGGDTEGTTGGSGSTAGDSTGISPDYGVPTTGE
ncbi:MAG: hypothetical protein ACE37F_20955 [Nannocystaceae bacterium]|nr:hypothetical protein [bacterium]